MSDQGVAVTPTDVAEHLGISTPSMTGILNRLYTGGIITSLRHPDDGRSKYVVPLDRDGDIDGMSASPSDERAARRWSTSSRTHWARMASWRHSTCLADTQTNGRCLDHHKSRPDVRQYFKGRAAANNCMEVFARTPRL